MYDMKYCVYSGNAVQRCHRSNRCGALDNLDWGQKPGYKQPPGIDRSITRYSILLKKGGTLYVISVYVSSTIMTIVRA